MRNVCILLLIAMVANSYRLSAQKSTPVLVEDYQEDTLVFPGISNANNLMQLIEQKEYKKYVLEFHKRYPGDSSKENNYKADLYNLACAYTKLKNYDKAFNTLEMLSDKLRFDDAYVLGDYDLEPLHNDKRWIEFAKEIRLNYLAKNKNITHPELAIKLSTWAGIDQTYIRLTQTVNGRTKFRQKNRALVDSLVVIFEVYGYPTPKMVGAEAYVPALIIAHAEYGTQLMYREFLYREGIKGNIPSGMAGVVIDKILVKQGKPQLYGTQGCYDSVSKRTLPCPIQDIEHLEERRREMGFLMSWDAYVKLQESLNEQ